MTTPLRFLVPLFVGVLVACGAPVPEEFEPAVSETSQEVSTSCSNVSTSGCAGAAFGTVCEQTGTCQLNLPMQQYFPGACYCPGGTPEPVVCPADSLDGCANLLRGSACVTSTGAAGTCSFRPSKHRVPCTCN